VKTKGRTEFQSENKNEGVKSLKFPYEGPRWGKRERNPKKVRQSRWITGELQSTAGERNGGAGPPDDLTAKNFNKK